MEKYDYLIVGAGLFGAVFAMRLKKWASVAWSLTNVTTEEEISIVRI